MKNIELPRKVLVGDDMIFEVDEVVSELGLAGQPLILCDSITKEVAADTVSQELGFPVTVVSDLMGPELKGINLRVQEKKMAYVVGVGGGRILDAGKVIAFENKIPFISVPTAASHDGIASPQASLKADKPISVQVHCPLGVIADTKIISKAPRRLLAAGCGDAVSNYTAVLDWQLAHKEKGEYYGDYSAALSSLSSEIIIKNADKVYGNISILVEALISSGVAIGIAGNSRPCSGSEHMFSHLLDMICEKPALHGEQCGVGAIIMAYLHDAEWKKIRTSLKRCQAPITAKEMGIPDEKIIAAIVGAHKIRDRYTILRDGVSERKARQAAEETGVI
jgi:glycerol-1-phosphate dehydrogenase [NAD(P)+]